METEFTPLASFGGGLLIGAAAVLLMALHGRILGATGILGGLFRLSDLSDWALRAALVAGMAAGPLAYLLATGTAPELGQPVPGWAVALGGLIVGLTESFGGLFLGESLGQIGISLIFILILLFRPQGLFGSGR